MPGRKKRSSQVQPEEAYDDDEEMDVSQASQSGRQPALPPGEESRLAGLAVRYMLAAHGRDAVIRRQDIRTTVLAKVELPRGALDQVLAAAARQLETVFGLSVIKLSNKRDMVLVNQLENCTHVQLPEEHEQRRGLLMLLLALIFMSSAPVKEDLLWLFLKKFGIDRDKPHECFGDVKKLIIKDFVRWHYLEVKKIERDGISELEFSWGERAHAEVQKIHLLQFVCKMWGDDIKPEEWTEQYQKAMAQQDEPMAAQE